MKNLKLNTSLSAYLLGLIMILVLSCERDLSDDAVFATFNTDGEIYTDAPLGLTNQFFRSFDPAVGANLEAFSTDDNVAFEGTSSIRIDVPAPNNPDGSFVGGIFEDRGIGRNLTQFDALTFYIKGSTTAVLDEVGFGNDFDENKFFVRVTNVQLSTDWQKVIIPIPDPSKLVQERGMFFFADGTAETNGLGYTFWIDELRFEKLGNIGQSRPSILGGNANLFPSEPGQETTIGGLQQTFNLGSGRDQTIQLTPFYFDFESSNTDVAVVDDAGNVIVAGLGESVISASIAGVLAEGSLVVQASPSAPLVTLFSDIFGNAPVDNWNGFYTPDGQTTQGGLVNEGGNEIIDYTAHNFVGIEFYGRDGSNIPPIDASNMTNFNIDVRVNQSVSASESITITLINNVGSDSTSGSYTISGADLVTNQWVSFNIPFSDFTDGLAQRNALGILITASSNGINAISLDNIFFTAE